jgi:hypothetical protein
MSDELNTVLRLVAEGKLSPDEAAPIIEALSSSRQARSVAARATAMAADAIESGSVAAGTRGRRVRIQVNERGRRVVDVRVPLAFAAMAARMVPGIPDRYSALIEQAVDSQTTGTIVDAEDENGDGVLISLE